MSKEAIKQMVEALEDINSLLTTMTGETFTKLEVAVKAGRQAIEEAEKQEQGEPVAWTDENVIAWCLARGIKAAESTQQPKQEHGEPVAATDIQISYEAHAEDPEDWNDLNFKECWHKGFTDGFKAAETFHKIGVSQ